MYGDVYNTTVNVNGVNMYSARYYPGNCCCGFSYPGISCFGFGFSNPANYIGVAAGCAIGAAAVPFIPAIFKGIAKGIGWLGKSVIAPAATAVWKGISWFGKSVIAPAATAAWKGICSAGEAIGKGVSNLWNKIFHKKKNAKAEKAE